MGNLDRCPHCDRKATGELSSVYFPLYTCLDCETKYCSDDGPPCPECGSENYGHYDDVYVWLDAFSQTVKRYVPSSAGMHELASALNAGLGRVEFT